MLRSLVMFIGIMTQQVTNGNGFITAEEDLKTIIGVHHFTITNEPTKTNPQQVQVSMSNGSNDRSLHTATFYQLNWLLFISHENVILFYYVFVNFFLFFNRYNHNGITIIECHEHEANHLQFACSFLRASNAWLCHIKVQYHGRLPYEMMIDVEIATKSKTSFNIFDAFQSSLILACFPIDINMICMFVIVYLLSIPII